MSLNAQTHNTSTDSSYNRFHINSLLLKENMLDTLSMTLEFPLCTAGNDCSITFLPL